MNPDKTRENRLRRMAERQGLALEKSERRDPRASDSEPGRSSTSLRARWLRTGRIVVTGCRSMMSKRPSTNKQNFPVPEPWPA